MRVRIAYTVDVTDEFRRSVNRYYGDEGMATRQQISEWFENHGKQMDDEVTSTYGDEDA